MLNKPKCLGRKVYSESLIFAVGMLMFKNIFFRIFVGFHGTVLLFPVYLTQDYRASPFYPNTPYLWVSNAPTELCEERHSIKIDMSLFTLSGSPRKQITEQGIAIFYIDKLGYCPYIELNTGENVNGGLPQLGCLKNHLDKASNDICHYIASDKLGLAVIDWPGWRPIWSTNVGPRLTYKNESIDLVLKQNLTLTYDDAAKIAEVEFEEAGKSFMQETLKLGKLLRPKFLWGFYLFPDCYNKRYNKSSFNGSCVDTDIKRNNDLNWLWKESTALYPSIYLNTEITDSQKTTIYVQNRVLEALRVSQMHNIKDPLPVFVYIRPVFTNVPEIFLSKDDLVNTIGESIALGVSGLVMWGGYDITQSVIACKNIEDFMTYTLNPYIINVTLAAKMCSQVLCQEQGVCTRKHGYLDGYLHLNPRNFVIQSVKGGNYTVHGKPTVEDLQEFSQKFDCSCYSNINCITTVDVNTINHIHVCITDNICIDAFLKSKLSDPS